MTPGDCISVNPVNKPLGDVGNFHCSTRYVGPETTRVGALTPSGTTLQTGATFNFITSTRPEDLFAHRPRSVVREIIIPFRRFGPARVKPNYASIHHKLVG